MHRFLIVALAALIVTGCDRFPDNGLQIAGMIPLEGETCVADPNSDARLTFGVWDVQDPAGTEPRNPDYFVSPLLENYIRSRALDIQAETNNLQVDKLEITLRTPDDVNLVLPGLPNPYTVTASANLPAATEDMFTVAAAITQAIPSSYRVPIRDAVFGAGFNQVVVVIRAMGTTSGGFTQKSGPFYWPITLCEGCLNFCPTAGSVDMLTEAQIALLLTACNPGQDGYPYCQFDFRRDDSN